MPNISRRGLNAPASPIRKLAPYAEAARARGLIVHQLNIGQPDIPTAPAMLAAYRAFDEPVIAYCPSDGFVDYREKLADYYNGIIDEQHGKSRVTADDIVVTVGGSEALLFAIGAICDPGDDFIVCEPYYTNYRGFAHMLSVNVTPLTTTAALGFRIIPSDIESRITKTTRAIVLPNPGNPTGVVLTREEVEAIAGICKRNNIFFVCDEVYREFVYDAAPGQRAPSVLAVADFDDYAVVIDSVSKRYSACGARVGALITRNKELRAAALRFGQARLSPTTVDQLAAMAALDTPQSYFDDVVARYRGRRDQLVADLRAIGVTCGVPQGAFYLIATLPVEDTDDFCRFMLEDFESGGETVMLAPASGFYATPGLGKNEVRIAYVLDRKRLSRSVEILEAGLKAYADR